MFYNVDLAIAKNTTELAPKSETIRIWKGIIHCVRISFPAGCAGLAGVKLSLGGHQIAPTNQGTWFRGDDEDIEYNEYIICENFINDLTVTGFNTDTNYSHTVIVAIGVLPEEFIKITRLDYNLMYAVVRMIDKLGEIIDKLESR